MRSYALNELSWTEIAAHVERERRLIVPVGTCDQNGPHLPVGASTYIAEALACDLSQEFGVLRAPTFHYGVNVRSESDYAGTSSLKGKTLHRALNELVSAWEDHGFTEFILITTSADDPHVEALATVTAKKARIRVVEALEVDLSEYLTGPTGPQHGGETTTSILLHLRPEVVRLDRAQDYAMNPEDFRLYLRGRLPRLPVGCPGSVGHPSYATAETGERIYRHILGKVRQRVFITPEPDPA